MTDIQTPQEGECFYLPGKGVVMVHHPQKDKRLVYGEYEGSLLVSTIHTFEPTPLTPETLDALLPVPSKRQVEDAFHVSHNSEQPHFFQSDFFDKHLNSPNLEDVAKACLYAGEGYGDGLEKKHDSFAFAILTSVDFYHRTLKGKSQRAALAFVTKKAQLKKHKEAYRASIDATIIVGDRADKAARQKQPSPSEKIPTFLANTRKPTQTKTTVTTDRAVLAALLPTGKPAKPTAAAKPKKAPLSEETAKDKPTTKQKETTKPVEAAEATPTKPTKPSKPAITEEQILAIHNAAELAKAKDESAPSSVASKRLSELFEKGTIGFEDTVLLLRHVFARPSRNAENTAQIINSNLHGKDLTATDVTSGLSALKKRIKKKFDKASSPADQTIYRAVFDWRPPEM